MGQNKAKLFASGPLNIARGQTPADFRSLETKQMTKNKTNSFFLSIFYFAYLILIIIILIIIANIMYYPSSIMTQNAAQNNTENVLTLM